MKFKEATQYILNRLDNELPGNLYYHGPHHTKDVIEIANHLADIHKLNKHNKELILTAAAYHDSGFLFSYRGHEEKGCEIVLEVLPSYGYSKEDIEIVCELIMATKVPTNAKNLFEEILCDADLDYLGRSDFDKISNFLYREFVEHDIVSDELSWYRLQKAFISSHHFYNKYSQEKRESVKQDNLKEIVSIVEKLEKESSHD